MPIEHYALGNDLPKEGFHFCHTIERRLDGLGRVTGSTSNKFGVYFGRTKSDAEYRYRYTKKFGSNHLEAFENIKQALIDLVDAGKQEDIETLVSNPISTMFKGKILSTYYPDADVFMKYLPNVIYQFWTKSLWKAILISVIFHRTISNFSHLFDFNKKAP